MVIFDSIKDDITLVVKFSFLMTDKIKNKKSLDYLGALFDFEGKGSLYYFLKQKEWVEEIVSEEDEYFHTYFCPFTIVFTLTEEG